MELIDYLTIILRHKWIILGSFLVALAATTTQVFLSKPIYESQCKILLVDDKGKNSLADFSMDDMMLQTLGKSDPIQTQIEILKTRPIFEQTIKRCNIRTDKNELISVNAFQKRFKFDYIKATNIITITYRDTDREKAPFITNALASVFSEQNQKLNQEEMRIAKEFIENQLTVQKRKIEEAELMVMNFKSSSKTVSLDKETSLQVNAIAGLESELISLQSQLKGVEAQKCEIENRLKQTGSQAAPYYSTLLATNEQTNSTATNLNARITAIKNEIDKQYLSIKDLPPLETKLARLVREQQIMNEIYTNMLSKYEEYKIREVAQVSSIKMIEPAIAADIPVLPKKKKNIALAGLAGLFLGFGISFLIEYLRDRPYSIDEIKKLLGDINTLGTVPYFIKESPLFMKDNSSSIQAESIRIIHTNLKFSDAFTKEHISLMATSSQPGEGKTTLSANLAIEFAKMGKNTALVNLDLRNPSFEKLFKDKFKKGLTDYLIGEASFQQIAHKIDLNGLTIIPCGQRPPNPTELIASQKMADFVNHVHSSFDIVLFDTAPITMVAESLDIARKMDGIIIVADASNASRRGLQAIHNIFQDKELPVLGVVVNKVGKEMLGKYRYGYYGYGYGYGSQQNKKDAVIENA